jgi:pimeloyl-ACP methyl ester carboxylesterase
MRALGDTCRLIAWNAPGYLGSQLLETPRPDVTEYARAVIGLLDALDIERCCVVGSSLGGLIAASVAQIAPERVSGLVFSAPATGYGSLPAQERDRLTKDRIDTMRRLGPEGLARERSPFLLGPNASADVLERTAALLAALEPDPYIQASYMLGYSDVLPGLPDIDVSAVVLCGTEDRITPLEGSPTAMHQGIPGAELRVLDGIGHMVKIEAPDAVTDAIRDVLDRTA